MLLSFVCADCKQINKAMDDKDSFLLKIQIAENCRLALPDGLKELMSDISREVLRAQPENILLFITKYLAALLVTRENMHTATHICDDMCDHICAANLEDELRYKGFDEENIDKVKEIVTSYLLKAGTGIPIKEGNIVLKILKETTLNVGQIEDVRDAVRTAVLRHLARNTTNYELTPESSLDSVNRAVQHTLDLYHKSHPTQEDYERAATTIGAAYRAYGVRRAMKSEKQDGKRFVDVADTKSIEEVFFEDESLTESEDPVIEKHISFAGEDIKHIDDESEACSVEQTNVNEKIDDDSFAFVHQTRAITTVSSTSLAGSFLNLPIHKPYTVFDELKEVAAEEEMSLHTCVDYDDEDKAKYEEYFPRESIEEKCVDYIPADYEPDDIGSSVDDEDIYVYDDHVSFTDIDEIPEDFDKEKHDSIDH